MELLNSCKKGDLEWARNLINAVSRINPDYENALQTEIEHYEKEKITIAVIGLMKRGKSTFCNAFLNRNDDELAPVGKLPATGIISKYCSHATRREAEIRFINGDERIIDYADIRQYVTEEFNPENKKQVEFVTIYGDFSFDEDVELMDMPGDGSIHACHTEIVYRYLPKADVIIFMSSAQDPVQKEELALLKKVNKDLNNIFFVINKVDKCDDEEILEAEEQDQKVLANAGINVRKLYKVSAKKVLEGDTSPDYVSLLDDIKNFLRSNKINLLRSVFIKRVIDATTPALNLLTAGTELKKLELTELNQALVELNNTSAVMREQAAQLSSSFEEKWKLMIDEFSAALPEAEEKVQHRVAENIKSYPMVSINQKMLNQLPELISSVIEEELSKPTQAFEAQVRHEIEKINTDFPSVSKYLADENYRLNVQKQLGYSICSSVLGGAIFSTGALVSGSISSVTGGLALIPGVGSWLAGVASVLAFPLSALAAIGMFTGGAIMVIPFLGWLRRKKLQKQEVLDSARASIENAFRSMRLYKIPELARKAPELTKELNSQLERDLATLDKQLHDAIQRKETLKIELEEEKFKKEECALEALKDLIEEGNKMLTASGAVKGGQDA